MQKNIKIIIMISVLFSTMFPLQVFATTSIDQTSFLYVRPEIQQKYYEKYGFSGYDYQGNSWRYEPETRTIYFSGTGVVGGKYDDDLNLARRYYPLVEIAKHVVIEDGITEIKGAAFGNLDNIVTVKIADSVTRIGADAFNGCHWLEEVQLSNNLMRIDERAFNFCNSLKSIKLPESLEFIGENAFRDCSAVTSIEIPSLVTKIPYRCFCECYSLEEIKLASNLKIISDSAFSHCSKLSHLDIPKSVTTVYMTAFSNTKLKKIVLPASVKKINRGELFLKSDTVFNNKKLRVIEIHSKEIDNITKRTFSGLSSNVIIKVPKSTLKKYRKMFYKSGLSKKIKVKKI